MPKQAFSTPEINAFGREPIGGKKAPALSGRSAPIPGSARAKDEEWAERMVAAMGGCDPRIGAKPKNAIRSQRG